MNKLRKKQLLVATLAALSGVSFSLLASDELLASGESLAVSPAAVDMNSGINTPVLQTYSNHYDIGFEDVVTQALDVSHDYKALRYEMRSTEIQHKKEKRYFIPSATLSSEHKEYYSEHRPFAESTGKATFKLSSRLWGTSVSDRIDSSKSNLLSGEMNEKGLALNIYYVVLRNLTKVELTRQFERQADEIRVELEFYYQKQLNATKEGVSTKSDAMEVELTKSRFEEQVFAVVTNIDRYFRDLRIETGLDFGSKEMTDRIGIDYVRLQEILQQDYSDFDASALIKQNYALRSTEYQLNGMLSSAKAQRERFKVDLVNETKLELYDNNRKKGWEWRPGDTTDSHVALNFTLDLFNYGMSSEQNAAFEMYKAERERYDRQIQMFMAQLEALTLDYENTMAKRNNLVEQLRINRQLIENQKNEIYTDKVTYKDIADSISSLTQSEIALLNMELGLFDLVYQLMELKSEKIY